MKYVGLLVVFMSLWPRTIKFLFSNWPRTQNFSQFYKNTGREDLFLSWSRVACAQTKLNSGTNHSLVIVCTQARSRVGHALRPIFMLWLVNICQVSTCGKAHAASWKLFTLTACAEAYRVLCQLVMFLTAFFHWMYKMKYSCYQESSVICLLGFGWEMRRLSKFGNPISDGIVFVFHRD